MAELIWDGKYKDGKKVAPVRIALPFQTIETVNESVQDRQKSLDMFSTGRSSDWKNRLIWGDKKYVLPSLLSEFSGKVNLIYIDPPFNVGADFSFTAEVPDTNDSLEKEPSMIELKAYRDTWGQGMDSYLKWFYETVVFLKELLTDDGSLYVHLDWHVGHYAKVVLDEVFGEDHFLNEVIWKRTGAHNDADRYGIIHDDLYLYSKGENWKFNTNYTPYTKEYIAERFRTEEEGTGRKFWLNTMTAAGQGPPRAFEGKVKNPPKGTHWRFSQEKIDEYVKSGKIVFSKSGMPYVKQYLDESPGRPIQSIWDDLVPSKSGAERINYSTQKPEILLERIINVSSNPGDIVADFFCGSGTTLAVSEKMGRKWIGADLGRFAIQKTRKRLLSIPGVTPFVLQNLGKYERQAWQTAEFPEPGKQVEKELKYRRFILDLYKAEPVSGFNWIHGIKKDRLIHVGAVDSPVTLADVKAIAAETWKSVGKGKDSPKRAVVDILGWDFALEVNEIAKQIAAESGVEVHIKVIPREVLEKKAVEQGDIKFFELASLAVDIKTTGLEITANLKDFVIPPNDVPAEIQKEIKHYSQWVDYWAIDWDYKNDTFHNEWQSYRSRQNQDLDLTTSHTYEKPGEYQVVVKVIDILGNDTTKLLKVQVSDAKKKK